jgi:hypothetical protein
MAPSSLISMDASMDAGLPEGARLLKAPAPHATIFAASPLATRTEALLHN